MEGKQNKRANTILGMLTLANRVSHYKASARPSKSSQLHSLSMAPFWPLGARVRCHSHTNRWRDKRSLTIRSGVVRSVGVSFFSSDLWALDLSAYLIRVRQCINLCTKWGRGASMCSILCEGMCLWNEVWHEEGRPVGKSFPWGWGASDVTSDMVFSESQERRWSKLSFSSCSFQLKV